ncbi:helix-turn-helix domain-containing protein [Neisseria zoodegmatis]|uniref:Ner-like DNA-binding prophage protein n=3 Tax=Neisseria TaxID=482 RepID=A0AB38DNT8_9NEIS|nr:helix-turn-helix domain-containing protein [Neisseria zoodegmatis]KPN73697.1 hypothetical protein AKG43_06830 [Neisseria sp. 74A18]OSI09303.1 hypothetical protein BWD10_10285 [Neisseria zoodegmatis]SNU78653.1 putative Ner-like DNA-binding prophage protein [Neisseria zoodegmatis]
MHPELIKAKLRIKGFSLTDVAKQEKVGEHAVRKALRQPSLSGEKAIANVLGKELHELWPDRWTIDGKRIRPRWAHLYKEAS